MTWGRGLAAVVALFLLGTSARAGFIVNTGAVGYTGNWTRYDTLSNALAGGSAGVVSTGLVPQRDLGLLISNGAGTLSPPGFQDPTNLIVTRWYDPDPSTNPNPNNTPLGFLQIFDEAAATVTSASGVWLPGAGGLTSYQLQATGGNATYANSMARFGEASVNNPLGADSGTYQSYSLSILLTGTNGQPDPGNPGFFTASSFTGASGSFLGVFENQGPDPSRNGFYRISLTINTNLLTQPSTDTLLGSTQVAAVPAPPGWVLFASGLGVMTVFGRLHRRLAAAP
jgi:hypothetical protein